VRFVPLQFRSTTPDDLPAIRRLLQTAFGIGPDAPSIDAKLLAWKYQIARGYVLEQDGALLSHGALWPGTIQTKAGPIGFANLLDWASVKSPAGMGVVLLRRLSEVSPLMVSTGGSAQTRSLMPRIGFRHVGNQAVWARVVRPFRQFRTRPKEGLVRSMTRLARNAAWSMAPPVPLRGWRTRTGETACPTTLPRRNPKVSQAVSPVHPSTMSEFSRGAKNLELCKTLLLECPGASVSNWSFDAGGFFVLVRVGGQCRIARLRIESEQPEDWISAYAVACLTAEADPETCEVIALSSNMPVSEALAANSFHVRDHRPTFVYDPNHIIPPDAGRLEFDMLDDDMAYMNVPEHPYLT